MKRNHLCMMLVVQFSTLLAAEYVDMPQEHDQSHCLAALDTNVTQMAKHSQSSPEEVLGSMPRCKQHDAVTLFQLIKLKAIDQGDAQKAAFAQKLEDHESLGWRAKNPDLNTGLSVLIGAVAGGSLGLMLGLAASGLLFMGGI